MDDLSDYRPCAGVMLLNREGLVFIGRRITPAANHAPAHIWQMPQGGIDEGEDPYDAALRELREETNVVTTSLLGTAPDWYRYDVPGGMVRGHKVYKGQRQKWFALRFDGADNEIDIAHPADGAHAEFDAWRWESLDQLPELVVPFKRPIYERLVEVFRPLVEPQ